ncbi:MAG: hypothetical protein IIC83_03760 [Chloroflexi bacterium]|nr:hypothetical protein [Chloroflexota bacterium]
MQISRKVPQVIPDIRKFLLLASTFNLMFAIKDIGPCAWLVKPGSMGEYGTLNVVIPEGFFEIEYNGRKDRLPFLHRAASIQIFGIPESKTAVIHPGIAPQSHLSVPGSIRRELDVSDDVKIVLSVGRNTPAKGVEEFGEIARILIGRGKAVSVPVHRSQRQR